MIRRRQHETYFEYRNRVENYKQRAGRVGVFIMVAATIYLTYLWMGLLAHP